MHCAKQTPAEGFPRLLYGEHVIPVDFRPVVLILEGQGKNAEIAEVLPMYSRRGNLL